MQYEEMEMRGKFKPQVDKKSKDINRLRKERDGKWAELPLSERYQKIMEDKNKKLELMRRARQEIEQEQDPDEFNPSFKPNTKMSQ